MQRLYRPPWRIDLDVRPGVAPPLARARLADTVAAALSVARAPSPASIGLILADDAELAELNAQHLGTPGPTDVLAFPLFDPAPGEVAGVGAGMGTASGFVLPPGRRPHLGDVIISVERAIEQASAGQGGQTGDVRWSPADELRLLAVHGTLHVCGWDHASPEDEAAMRALERRILAA